MPELYYSPRSDGTSSNFDTCLRLQDGMSTPETRQAKHVPKFNALIRSQFSDDPLSVKRNDLTSPHMNGGKFWVMMFIL